MIKFWHPIDFYIGTSATKRRILEIPTYAIEVMGERRAIRLEFWALLHWCIVMDFAKRQL